MQRFMDLSKSARTVWAKSADTHGHGRHGVLAHMLDVAAVAEVILRRESAGTRKWASSAFGLAESGLSRWISIFCGLHDFGKAIPGFQAKWLEGQKADEATGLKFQPAAMNATRHDLASAFLLHRALFVHYPNSPWIAAVSQALGAHHGYLEVAPVV